MSTRAAAAVLLLAGLGVAAVLIARRASQASAPTAAPDYTGFGDASAGYSGNVPDYTGFGDSTMPSATATDASATTDGDVTATDASLSDNFFLQTSYRVENIFMNAAGSRMQTSLAGLDLITREEGFSATPYQDVGGYWTIGYGHKIKPGESFASIDEATARTLLAGDLSTAEDAVNSLVTVPLTQPQFDALVDLVYNIGAGAFRRSTLLAKLNQGDYAGAQAQFAVWRISGGKIVDDLVRRRATEAQLFASGMVQGTVA